MSTVGIRSPTPPTTQSPATTPNQTLPFCNVGNDVMSVMPPTNETDQVTTRPASQTYQDSISSEVSSTTSTVTASTASPIAAAVCSTTLSGAVNSLSLTNRSAEKHQRQATSEDVDEVARLFEEKPEAFEKWLMERAPHEAVSRLHEFIESRKQPLKRPSVTSDLFQQWMSSSPLQVSGKLHSF